MKLHLLEYNMGVIRLDPETPIPDFVWQSPFYSITRTVSELSLFLAADSIPESVEASREWRALHVVGSLDFEVSGVISGLTLPLASRQISVFSISTYETDYLIVPSDRVEGRRRSSEERWPPVCLSGVDASLNREGRRLESNPARPTAQRVANSRHSLRERLRNQPRGSTPEHRKPAGQPPLDVLHRA